MCIHTIALQKELRVSLGSSLHNLHQRQFQPKVTAVTHIGYKQHRKAPVDLLVEALHTPKFLRFIEDCEEMSLTKQLIPFALE